MLKQQPPKDTIAPAGILFIVFLALKLTHITDWSWWWVTAPLWMPYALVPRLLGRVFGR